MKGNSTVYFSDLFTDTVRTHGRTWAWVYYVKKHHMPEWEFDFWLRATGSQA